MMNISLSIDWNASNTDAAGEKLHIIKHGLKFIKINAIEED